MLNRFTFILIALLALANTARGDVYLGADLLQDYPEGMQYYYEGEQLQKNWGKLHYRDSVDYPSADQLSALLSPFFGTEHQDEALPDQFNGDFSQLAPRVAEAWRLYHAGQYKSAYELADTLGLAGALPKLRSLSIHHHFFVPPGDARRDAFAGLIKHMERMQEKFDLEMPAFYLLKAFAIGRYGQEINPVSAFTKGLGGKLKKNIYRAAELAPNNVEAMMFKAVFHSEVTQHAGFTGRLLYGSNRDRALEDFEAATSESPQSTALLLEYGKACLKLCEKNPEQQSAHILHQLVSIPPKDMTDQQNIQLGKQVLEKKLAKKKSNSVNG
ncbi:putative tetratricopeptide repeat family protein [gamma proteobacterium HTCC5015]|nr:putative tetratricopeptide repeat family protein [gamma proteobacterium HTCC5015]